MMKRVETRREMLFTADFDESGLLPDEEGPFDKMKNWNVSLNKVPNENPHLASKVGDKVFMDHPSVGNIGTVVAVHSDPQNDPYAWSHLMEGIGNETRDEYLLAPGESADNIPPLKTISEISVEALNDGQKTYEQDVAQGIYMYDIKWDMGNGIGDWIDGRRVWPLSEKDSHQWYNDPLDFMK